MSSMAGLPLQAYGMYQQKKMGEKASSDWENIFEEYYAPFLRAQRKVYEPTGAAIRERLMTPTTSYGFEPQWQQARERITGASREVGQRYAQEYQRRRIGSPVYGKLQEARGAGELKEQRELARDIAIQASTERARRIGEGLSFSGMQPPQIPIGRMPSGGAMDWSEIAGGVSKDMNYWKDWAFAMKEIREESRYQQGGEMEQGVDWEPSEQRYV